MRHSTSSTRSLAIMVAVLLGLHFCSPGCILGADDPSEPLQSLPEGALTRLGSDAFSTNVVVADLAYSPDGKFIAIAHHNTPTPFVTLMDAQSGMQKHVLYCNPRSKGSVHCLAFSPDGKELVAGDWQGTLTFFSMAKKFATFRRKLHERSIEDVNFSANGQFIATAGEDGKVQVLNAESREVVQSVTVTEGARKQPAAGEGDFGGGRASGLDSVVMSADGSRLVAGAKGQMTVWNVKSGELLRTISPDDYDDGYKNIPQSRKLEVKPVKILSDGRTLLTAGNRTVPRSATKILYGPTYVRLTRIQLWNLETGEHLRDLNEPEDNGFGYAAISPDERLIAVANFSRLTIRRVEDGQVLHEFSLPGSWGDPLVFSPDSKQVAMRIHTRLEVFDVDQGVQLRADPSIPKGSFSSANWSADGSKIVTGHGDGFVRVWNVSTGEVEWVKQLAPVISPSGSTAKPQFVAFTPDDKRIIAAGTKDDPENWTTGIIAAFDAVTGKRLIEQITDQEVRTAALSPDGRTIVAATSNGSLGDTHVYGIDAGTGERRFVNPAEDVRVGIWSAETIQFTPDSASFFIATGDSHILKYDSQTGKLDSDFLIDWRTPAQKKANQPKTPQLWEAAFSPDGKMLVSSSREHVYVWDTSTGDKTLQIRHPHDHGCRVEISPDTKVIATSDLNYSGDPGDDLVRFFDTRTGEELGTLDPDGRRAYHLIYSPDGSKLFHGTFSGASLIWDMGKVGLRAE